MKLVPFGGPEGAYKAHWGMRPAKVGWASDLAYPGSFAWVSLDGFLRDPRDPAPYCAPMELELKHPRLDALPPEQYDFAIAANLKAVRRLIEMGFNRGYFDHTSIGKNDDGEESFADIVEMAPVMTPLGGNGHGNIHVVLRLKTEGLGEWWAFHESTYRVALDIDFYLRPVVVREKGQPSDHTAFQLVIDHINPETAYVYGSDIEHAKDIVHESMKERIAKANREYAAEPSTLSRPISLATELFGVTYHSVRGAVDPNGYLVFYMAFGDSR